MPVDTKHPDYVEAAPDWKLMRDAVAGSRVVKEAGETYLPMPSGFSAHPAGSKMYDAYKKRAKFPTITGPTVRGMNGVIHRTELQIDLPDVLKPMWERATPEGLTLEALAQLITEELLSTGRYALLADMPTEAGADTLPFIAGYRAETLINWAPTRDSDFFVLDETSLERNEFEWVKDVRYRVLELVDGKYQVAVYRSDGAGSFAAQAEDITAPVKRGAGGAFDRIPLVVIGANRLGNDIDEVPLIGVAEAAMAAYRLDADYRHQLFMSGQETLFCYGVKDEEKPSLVGAGVVHAFSEASAKAEYVGPSGEGISAHRVAIIDERDAAIEAGARLFSNDQKAAESGDALRLRYGARSATLTSISKMTAQGLERALKSCAEFVGADPAAVVVKPNLEFIDSTLSPSEVKDLVAAWQGGGISYRTLFENLQRGEVVSSERTVDEEMALIEDEMPAPARAVDLNNPLGGDGIGQ
jgi:hypothetical protein